MTGESTIPEHYTKCFKHIEVAAKSINTHYMLVGATARDLLFESIGIASQRLTYDIDISLSIDNWKSFDKFKASLTYNGFESYKNSKQRLIYTALDSDNVLLDVVPFGGIKDVNSEISWPPDDAVKMSVRGFQEAYEARLEIKLNNNLVIPVVSVSGLCLLKLIAWLDRPSDIRRKDAQDINFLLSNYEALDGIRDAVFEEEIPELYDFDLDKACSAKLGGDVSEICSEATREFLISKMFDEKNGETLELIAREMSSHDKSQAQSNYQIILAFKDGFMNQRN